MVVLRRVVAIVVVTAAFVTVATVGPAPALSSSGLDPLEPSMAYQWADFERTADGSTTTGRGIATLGLLTGSERIVTDGAAGPDRYVSWSPDGRSLLFARGDDNDPSTSSIIVRELATGAETLLASGYAPTWSPDGRRVAYVSGVPHLPSTAELVIAEIERTAAGWGFVADSEVRRPMPRLQAPAWSPHGDRLAFVVRRESDLGWSDCDLWMIDADGSDLHPVTAGLDVSPNTPQWSPSGAYLAFTVEDRTWFATTDGGHQQPAGSESYDYGGTWSPVADVFAVSAQGASQIALISPTAGEISRLTPEHQRGIFSISWLPTGTHLVFSAEEWPAEFGSPWYLWTVPIAGGEPRRASDQIVTGFGSAVMSPGLVVRTFGDTRIDTALALSRQAFTEATDAVLAPATSAVNALVAGPLAGRLGGPLLLTQGATLEPAVVAELQRLGVRSVWLVGDRLAISQGIEDALRALAIEVHRIDESRPEALAAAIAQQLPGSSAYAVHVGASGSGWADAVSVSALAAKQHRPILLVGHDSIPVETAETIDALGITDVTIIGGTAAVSSTTQQDLEARGLRTSRLAGRDRYATSAAVATASLTAGLAGDRPLLTTGQNWPDSLTAGPAAAAIGSVLLLVDGSNADHTTSTTTWLRDRDGAFTDIAIAGGAAAIAPEVEALLETLAPSL